MMFSLIIQWNNWFINNDSCQNIILEHHIVFIWNAVQNNAKKIIILQPDQ